MKRIAKFFFIPVMAMGLAGCGFLGEMFGGDTDNIHKQYRSPANSFCMTPQTRD